MDMSMPPENLRKYLDDRAEITGKFLDFIDILKEQYLLNMHRFEFSKGLIGPLIEIHKLEDKQDPPTIDYIIDFPNHNDRLWISSIAQISISVDNCMVGIYWKTIEGGTNTTFIPILSNYPYIRDLNKKVANTIIEFMLDEETDV